MEKFNYRVNYRQAFMRRSKKIHNQYTKIVDKFDVDFDNIQIVLDDGILIINRDEPGTFLLYVEDQIKQIILNKDICNFFKYIKSSQCYAMYNKILFISKAKMIIFDPFEEKLIFPKERISPDILVSGNQFLDFSSNKLYTISDDQYSIASLWFANKRRVKSFNCMAYSGRNSCRIFIPTENEFKIVDLNVGYFPHYVIYDGKNILIISGEDLDADDDGNFVYLVDVFTLSGEKSCISQPVDTIFKNRFTTLRIFQNSKSDKFISFIHSYEKDGEIDKYKRIFFYATRVQSEISISPSQKIIKVKVDDLYFKVIE